MAAAMSPADFKRVQALLERCSGGRAAIEGRSFHASRRSWLRVDQYIVQDIAARLSVPVQATPTFVISTKDSSIRPSSGFVTCPILKQFFDSLLSQ